MSAGRINSLRPEHVPVEEQEATDRAVGDAVRSVGLPVVACLTFDSGKQRDRTMTGVRPGDAARMLTDAGASFIGGCCGTTPAHIRAITGSPQVRGR